MPRRAPRLLGLALLWSALFLQAPQAPAHNATAALNLLLSNQANPMTYVVVDTMQDFCSSDSAEITCPSSAGSAYYGQDAQQQGTQASYRDNGDGTVSDLNTGVMWMQSPDTDKDEDIDADDKLTHAEAQSYCADSTLAGYDDWRLPDIKTLYSLIDFRGTDPSGMTGTNTSSLTPFIDATVFDFAYGDTDAGERVIDSQYASDTLYAADSGKLFGVNFADGRIKGYDLSIQGQDKTFFVICAREAEDYGQNDFVDNGDGTVSDQATGLMWTQADNGEAVDWRTALAYAQARNDANHLGHDDWRLPNAKELESVVDYSRSPDSSSSAAIDALFTSSSIINEDGATDYPFYWTSTTHKSWLSDAQKVANAAYLAFGRGLGYDTNLGVWHDVHGAGCQRSDPKSGDPDQYPTYHGPQGDVQRVFNYVRLVRDFE